MHHVAGREASVGTSFENVEEAAEAVRLARLCVASGLKTVLLAPYQAQVRRLQAACSGIPVHTIDSYQGKECEAVVLSVVRTRSPGFWEDGRRLTVALTSAKHVMRVCTDVGAWADTATPLGEMVRDARERELVVGAA